MELARFRLTPFPLPLCHSPVPPPPRSELHGQAQGILLCPCSFISFITASFLLPLPCSALTLSHTPFTLPSLSPCAPLLCPPRSELHDKAQGILLGQDFPDFEAETSAGPIKWHQYIDGSWAVLFSHPGTYQVYHSRRHAGGAHPGMCQVYHSWVVIFSHP